MLIGIVKLSYNSCHLDDTSRHVVNRGHSAQTQSGGSLLYTSAYAVGHDRNSWK